MDGALANNYLGAEAFDEDGDQQIEQDIVAERHEGHEVERGPVTCLFHAVEQDHVPVFLREDLAARLCHGQRFD